MSVRPALFGAIPGRRVPVFVDDGLLDRLPDVLASVHAHRVCEVVTDRNVDALLGRRVMAALRKGKWRAHKTVLPAGEQIKSARTIRSLHEAWFEQKLDRYTVIVVVGGGTVGDAVGYAAATFLRGLPLWQVPTTIIGQVDSAIGGKVGINHKRGKNLIGAFYQPAGIIIDPQVLESLPPRERRSGLGEVVKYGVIADAGLFRQCERSVNEWISGAESVPTSTLQRCARIKLKMVAADETDRGLRHHLNFGHTLGHALERWGGYRRFKHGEAVAMGMVAAAWMAYKRGDLTESEFKRLEEVCRSLYPRLSTLPDRNSDVTQHLHSDKKRMAGTLRWVLPHGLGRVRVVEDVTPREINGALRYALTLSRR
ncbi:MAG: 3-dehydroquinate synthase [candidate division Zixibacteria bacterium]|nr:3-dehydroquinate synthase [candidate division Zixibacteria bacterium]